jgi:ribosomal protein S18 acetylase RimI-like enzyme
MKFIQAGQDHLEIVTALFDEYRQFYKQESDLRGARDFITDRINKNQSVIFLALENETGAGFTQLYPSFSSVAMQKIWILNDLYVAPAFRRQNVAAGLISEAVSLGKQTGAARIILETDTDNFQAQALYEKIGFQKENHCYFYRFDI